MRQMPQDLRAEKALLGAMMLDKNIYDECSVSENDFYKETHSEIYRIMTELHNDNRPFDMISILDENSNLDIEYLNDCTTEGIIYSSFKHWEKIVLEKSKLRRYIEIMQNGLEMAFNNIDPQSELSKTEDFEYKGISEMTEIKELMQQTITNIEDSQTKSGHTGMETGIHLLDYKLDGLQKNKYCLLAARPSMGKTALMLQLANGVSSKGKNVAIYSLEMTKQELSQRMIIHQSQVHLKLIKDKSLGTKEYQLLNQAGSNLSKKKIYIDDEFDQTINSIYKSAKRLSKRLEKKGETLDLIMIDYIQLLNSDGKFENENKRVTYDSRQIKKIAKKLDTCVIALSQLSRGCENRANKRPMLSDLRDSGSLEQDADIVMFLYRDDYYREKEQLDDFEPDRMAEISISKNRGGETGTIKTEWNGGKQTFYNIK